MRQPSDPSPLLDDPALTSNSKGNKILKPTAFKGNELTSTSHGIHVLTSTVFFLNSYIYSPNATLCLTFLRDIQS